MALTQTLISAVGPLPLSNTFNAEGDVEVVFFVSGSAWTQTADTSISITLYLDDEAIGTSVVWSNEASSHKALVPIFIPAKLSYGQHTVKLVAGNSSTTTDYNDSFQVMVIY